MKKQKKILIQIIVFIIILLSGCKAFATEHKETMVISEDFKNYLQLSTEEKEKVIAPRMYDVPKITSTVKNPLKIANILGATVNTKYSLKDIIPDNIIVRDQRNTGSCWAFSSIGMLESTLALKDYKNGKNPVEYDFSERHMEYATSYKFKDGVNKKGFNRKVGDGGGESIFIPYLTNGTGAILEKDMPFENNEDLINLSEIENKNVKTEVNDTIDFPSYEKGENTTKIKQQIKEHIKNYGGICAQIYGASLKNDDCYNNDTGAIYCDDSEKYSIDHDVLIVGWDDNYSKDNFNKSKKPKNDGVWIIKNSWGTESDGIPLEDMKKKMFKAQKEKCIENGWTEAKSIPDNVVIEYFEKQGYTIRKSGLYKYKAYLRIGKEGLMYVSYEDANIYTGLVGITKAQTGLTYENIYQYDQYGAVGAVSLSGTNKVYLATVFNKKTEGTEYLTQVSISAPETYTCKVYVNPNGKGKRKKDFEQVQLKSGETETFDAGYHTIEFLNPVKITGDNFVVMLEIQGKQKNEVDINSEFNYGAFFGRDEELSEYEHKWDNVTVESGKCFFAREENSSFGKWSDASKIEEETDGNVPNFDTTIKAFTRSTLKPKVLESIKITTPPEKTTYVDGNMFNEKGMVVKAVYSDGTEQEITDYTIKNKSLKEGQTSVTIEYDWKQTTQEITVKPNVLERIKVYTPPTKTSYEAGEDFDKTGMIVLAVESNGMSLRIDNYTIKDGINLKEGQTSVTIEYKGKTTTQEINVKPKATTQKTVKSIKVKTMPLKTEYIQNKEELDLAGGVIEVTYDDDSKADIAMTSSNITISGFNNKVVGKNTITIIYKEKTTQFNIEIKEEKNEDDNKKDEDNNDNNDSKEDEENKDNDDSQKDEDNKDNNDSKKDEDNKDNNDSKKDEDDKNNNENKDNNNNDTKNPTNSNFDNMQGNVTRMRAYYFSDASKKEYTVISVNVNNVIFANENDETEYYYYLSSNPQENNIRKWVKINDFEKKGNQLSFEINTLDNSNYEEISNSDTLYLYIKEVATLDNKQEEKITPSLKLEVENINIEEYVDGNKIADIDSETVINPVPANETEKNLSGIEDSTIASKILPKTGKNILIIGCILILIVMGRIAYIKYKEIQIK